MSCCPRPLPFGGAYGAARACELSDSRRSVRTLAPLAGSEARAAIDAFAFTRAKPFAPCCSRRQTRDSRPASAGRTRLGKNGNDRTRLRWPRDRPRTLRAEAIAGTLGTTCAAPRSCESEKREELERGLQHSPFSRRSTPRGLVLPVRSR